MVKQEKDQILKLRKLLILVKILQMLERLTEKQSVLFNFIVIAIQTLQLLNMHLLNLVEKQNILSVEVIMLHLDLMVFYQTKHFMPE